MIVLKVILTLFVLIGSVPLFTSLYQFTLVGWHGWKNHYKKVQPFYPKVAIIVPAWNEGNVIGNTIERLYDLTYPKDSIRVYVVDDASTDHTPDVVKEKHDKYPNNVFHLRREKGGEGKAHTLNHGIDIILEENWAEAMLIIDADVLFDDFTTRTVAGIAIFWNTPVGPLRFNFTEALDAQAEDETRSFDVTISTQF